MSKLLAVLLVCVAGMAAAFQAAVNATLGSHVRAIPAVFTSFTIGTVALLCLALAAWRGTPWATILQGYAGAPFWAYAGGLLGVIMLTGMTYAVPVIGTSGAISIFVLLQLMTSVLIDTFGLAGRAALPLTWHQVVGIAIILVGTRLVLWR